MPQKFGRFAPNTLKELENHLRNVLKEHHVDFESIVDHVQNGQNVRNAVEKNPKAEKIAQKIENSVEEFCVQRDLPSKRKRKFDDADSVSASDPKAAKVEVMSADQIKAMLANTHKEIAARKRQLEDAAKKQPQVGPVKPQTPQPQPAFAPANADDSKTKAIAALQAQIASRMNKVGDALNNVAPVMTPVTSDKPKPVILDALGRTVDASGQQVQLSHHVPTLKANLRAKKRDEMREHVKEAPSQSQANQESKFFDHRVTGAKKAAAFASARPKRTALKFNEPGKYQQEGQRLRMKAQLEKLQADISTIARKTGITSATQLAKLVPKDASKARCPDVEWWDAHILESNSYEEEPLNLREGAITNLIEHPIQMMPLEPNKPVHIPVFLTKKEQKKLRRQNRREAWKEKQDKIRLGLLPPDEPKVKMSNLMRVLGTEAVQDPTKVEAHVRAQVAKRLANHEKANAERKLTPEQKKEKMIRKLKEDTSCGVNVAVYRVKSLINPSKKFKVETNAKQLYLTGCIVLYEDVNVIVVEGGPKQQKKYRQLMLKRIKWDEEVYKDKDGVEADNSCVLVWEGQTKERNFGEMKIKQCPTESFARDFFKKIGVEHYWDQAYSGAVLEATEDPM